MLDVMQTCYDQILHGREQDDDFMLKTFNALETLDDEDFLNFAKKKTDLWNEDELKDDVDALISTCAKKCNNLSKGKLKKKKNKTSGND